MKSSSYKFNKEFFLPLGECVYNERKKKLTFIKYFIHKDDPHTGLFQQLEQMKDVRPKIALHTQLLYEVINFCRGRKTDNSVAREEKSKNKEANGRSIAFFFVTSC